MLLAYLFTRTVKNIPELARLGTEYLKESLRSKIKDVDKM